MIQTAEVTTDPISFVLDHLWADLTRQDDPAAVLVSLCATKLWPEALMLAIAMELDAAKREEARQYWEVDADKPKLMDELGNRTLFEFLARHRNDWRHLRRPPVIGPPPVPVIPPPPM